MLSKIQKPIMLAWAFLICILPESVDAKSIKSFSYDKFGNLQEFTDPRGFTTKYQYDLLNRLEETIYPNNDKVKHFYDLSGIRVKMQDHRGITLFEPDEFGRISKVTFPDGKTVCYSYDSEGNLTKLIYPNGMEVEYTYDLSNRLEAVKDSLGVTRLEYDELSNNLKKKSLPNGVTTEYLYYKTRLISNVIHKRADGALIAEFRYFYDENGNRAKIEKITPTNTSKTFYSYDKLNRVTKAEYSNGYFEEFSYDGAGNRLSKKTPEKTIIYQYNEENRLVKAGDTDFIYDPAGNLVEKSSPRQKVYYSYDFNNRLISYSDGKNQVQFEYDGDGNRISKTVNGIRTEYINDLVSPVSQVLLKEVQGSVPKSGRATRYVYGGSRISQSSEDETRYYLYDSLGRNVSELTDSSGKVLDEYKYDSFGNQLSRGQTTPDSYKFCGEQFDEETGLIFLRNRYYDPEIGRFISKDRRPGKLTHPSTLNPYTYVENNPVNLVDPTGFESISPEEYERVVLHINDLPGAGGGQGVGGHAFLEFPDRNLFRGNYPEGMLTDDHKNINLKTTSFECYCKPSKVTAAIEAMDKIKWTASKNCVYTVVEAMKAMEFPNAEKIKLSKMLPLPSELRSQMLRLNGIDPNVITYPREKVVIKQPPPKSSPLSLNFSTNLDFGGVSLSKAATLHVNMAEIKGAAFDPNTGQIILFGPENRHLPPVDLDDLAVAVKSIYGIGIPHPQDPGVSIDPSSIPGQLQVRYDGATINTAFGQVMFEADRLLKCLGLGKDNITGQPVSANVSGYNNLINRMRAANLTGETSIRLWFVPDKIELIQSEDHKGMVFSNVRMKVLTEAQFNGSPVDIPASREFVDHFNAHFGDFERQFPIFEKLKTLGKITAIVKWIRENNIPFDISFLTDYQQKEIETAKYTPSAQSRKEWVTKKNEKRVVRGYRQIVPVEYHHAITLTGGINYSLNKQNYASHVDPTINNFTSSALSSRPSERDFIWSFRSPANRETFMAVAQSIYRTRKPGNVRKSYVDISFTVPGNNQLSLNRFYNSFSDKESSLGRGWRISPYELELPLEKITVRSQEGKTYATYKMILFRTPDGEYIYEPFSISEDDCPIFKSPHYSGLLKDNLNGTFSLYIPQSGHIDFDREGKLISISDSAGVTIEYQYLDQQLISIRHQHGDTIILEYNGSRLMKSTGPGNTYVEYSYHPDGQIGTVRDSKGRYLYYFYDSDKRLNKISDHLENVLFEAVYDDYNRATLVKEGSTSYQANFSLEKKIMKVSDDLGKESILHYDSQNRLISEQDSTGRIWKYAYEQDEIYFPTRIIDPKGGITECRYDSFGNPIYLKNSIGAVWRFFYGLKRNLIAYQEPNGRAVVSLFGRNNQPCQTFFNASLELDENEQFATTFKGFSAQGGYNMTFTYDKETGQLISRENSKEAKTTFRYHKNGEMKEIVYPTGYNVERRIDEKGRLVEISDGSGFQKSYDYDEYDHIKTIRTPAGSTQFSYDDTGNLKRVLDPRGGVTYYKYDNQDNLKEVLDAENGVSVYEYNSQNQLTAITLPNGSSKVMSYDKFGRIEKEIWGR